MNPALVAVLMVVTLVETIWLASEMGPGTALVVAIVNMIMLSYVMFH